MIDYIASKLRVASHILFWIRQTSKVKCPQRWQWCGSDSSTSAFLTRYWYLWLQPPMWTQQETVAAGCSCGKPVITVANSIPNRGTWGVCFKSYLYHIILHILYYTNYYVILLIW